MIINKKWKVGELAKQTGLTVRTLHHYDQIGLFSPSEVTDSRHRIYTETDITKLQQILSLKQLGFTLEEIKETIENPDFNPIEIIKVQLETTKKQIEIQQKLYSRLEGMYELLSNQQEVQSENFIKLIEVINMSEKYFTHEQLEKIKIQNEQFSSEEKKEIEDQWFELIAKIRTELEKKTPTNHPEVIELAKRWKELTNKFTDGDPEIIKAAERFHAENPNNALQHGIDIDEKLYKFIKESMSHI
ncbi:MerR family transcriptional regulator [Bacillus pseudomycoides]|uniref:MerR family transcriptional regulator n=1 Tax=Bacillus pseudomycoides TaxID=64104 RepID=UPI000BF1C97B|nr:MerR family transcriptional regulator [Bacillus pseudomycoides]PEM70562.1 transcriptional regulator, MerR [Bacillus pseudomycoides]PFZ07911.1 transcriptional regulator, MerR [Bacillus pseudomycoides]PGA60187.1 transcriptional regulator, MerR [Bacillus pseudomycoides]